VRDTRTRHWLYFRTPSCMYRQADCRFFWRVRNRKNRVVFQSEWPRPAVMPMADSVVAVLRTARAGSAGIGALLDVESQVRTNVLMLSPSMAPDRAIGYESADVLVWLNPDPAALPGVAQCDAIVHYVRQGGHLVLAAGSGWQALAQSFLADLLPARPTGSRLVKELPALHGFGLPKDIDKATVLMNLDRLRGQVLMDCKGRPVIVRGTVGVGRVTLIGFDPTTSPFADLRDRKRFWINMLEMDTERRNVQETAGMRPASGPLLRSLDEFPSFQPINFYLVAFFLIVYVILIGPVDYFVLKRLKKLHWTWVTFPSVAIASSLMAFLLLSSGRVVGFSGNRVSLVDASADSDEVAGTTYMTVLSPRQTRYRVGLEDVLAGSLVPLEFQALPTGGAGLRMSQTRCFVVGAGELIDRLLIRIWDAQTLEACWRAAAPALPEADLFLRGASLGGTVKNATRDMMHDAVILHRGRAIELGDIGPGVTEGLVRGARSSGIAAYVRRHRPKEFVSHAYQFGWRRRAPKRADADGAARWISLFSHAGAGKDRGLQRRWTPGGEKAPSVVFDMPARVQLPVPASPREAILMYGVSRSLVRVRMAGNPHFWDWTLMRVRVPVKAEARAKGDEETDKAVVGP